MARGLTSQYKGAISAQGKAVALLEPTPEQYIRTRMPLLTGGIRTDKAPQDLAPNEAILIHNCDVIGGVFAVDLGYAVFGDDAYIGTAMGAYQVFYSNGASDLILVTTSYVYVFVQGEWQFTSDVAAFNTTASYAAGANVFALNSTTGMIVGDAIGIGLNDGTQLRTTITNIASLNVTTAASVPVGYTVANSAPVAHPRKLNGASNGENQLILVQFPATGWVIISNCVDSLFYYYNGVTTTLPGLTSTTCYAMIVFHECLIIANTIESGVAYPGRIRQSDAGDATNWTTGISAIYNLVDTPDFILQLTILGSWMIVWREQSIMQCTYLGVLNEILFFQYMIYGEGIVSQRAVVETPDLNFFKGRAGIWSYDGSYTLTPVGDAVWNEFFSVDVNSNPSIPTSMKLNQAAESSMFLYYATNYDEVWIFYPSGANTAPDTLLRYSRKLKAWFHREHSETFVAANAYTAISQDTWADAIGIWSTDLIPWNSRVIDQNIPNIMLVPNSGDAVKVYDYASIADAGTVIPWYVITREFGDAQTLTRWDAVTIYGQGSAIGVSYSVDSGETWVALDVITLGATLTRYRLTFQVVSAYIMFQLSGTDPTFQLAWIDVGHEFESEW